MVGQKEIRVKIASTQKTKKITSAMKLVAAAKVNKMQKKLQETKPFSQKISEIFANLQSAMDAEQLDKYPLLQNKADIKRILLLVISSDRGLCGGYNANIIKATKRRVTELENQGKEVSLVTVGRKATTAFAKSKTKTIKSFTNLSSMPNLQEASLIANFAADLYTGKDTEQEAFDRIEVITTKFISMVNNEVLEEQFLPVAIEEDEKKEGLKSEPDVIFEPDSQTIVNSLLPMYIENSIYSYLLDATTSELAARMTAMSNATSNAQEVIRKLKLSYNKARQAAITQEISEIVGGAAAL